MKKYVLVYKDSGEYYPSTTNLQEAEVIARNCFVLPNSTFVPLEVEYFVKLELAARNTGSFVTLDPSGMYISNSGGLTNDLQEAQVYTNDIHLTRISIPVKVEKTIKLR